MEYTTAFLTEKIQQSLKGDTTTFLKGKYKSLLKENTTISQREIQQVFLSSNLMNSLKLTKKESHENLINIFFQTKNLKPSKSLPAL